MLPEGLSLIKGVKCLKWRSHHSQNNLLYLSVTIKYAIGLLRSFILASNRHRDDYRPRSSSAKVRYNQTLTLTIALTLSLTPTFAITNTALTLTLTLPQF